VSCARHKTGLLLHVIAERQDFNVVVLYAGGQLGESSDYGNVLSTYGNKAEDKALAGWLQ
jgi:hypothetical protein